MNKFTDDQQRIINDMGKNMIVSASAGSGKTTVMIERIVKLMVENNVPISRFLIVTFTKASSSDMKNKLIKKLSEKEPTSFLLEQIDDIPISDISNLHSFCARLLKSYFYEVGIDPAFVVFDEIEANAIKERAMDILFREQYETNPEFYDLIDIFSKNRKDYKLRELILKLDSFLSAESDPERWFNEGLNCYNNIENNPCAKMLNTHIIKSFAALEKECGEMIEYVNTYKQSKLAIFLQKMETNLKKIHSHFDYVKNSRAILDFENLGILPKVELEFDEIKEKVKTFRDKYKGIVDNLKGIALENPDKMNAYLLVTKKRVENLYNVTCRFKEIYNTLKKEKGGLDFNDLERFTYKVLQNTEVLNELKDKYEYIFVDEYQDINGMQEKIISLLSKENNRFMVGDVKQSIYRFRLCDPQIFINKYQAYSMDSKSSKVYDLNDNFRSHSDILDFCNFVFSRSMTNEFGGVDYASKKMRSGLEAWDNNKERANINLLYIDSHKESGEEESYIESVYSVEKHKNILSEEEKTSVAEALLVAKNISELMLKAKIYNVNTKRHRKIEYKDIVILTASRSEQLKEFINTLRDLDIPVSADLVSDAMDDQFVSGISNLFALISNSSHDEEMLSVLYSPLFNFSASELAEIKAQDLSATFSENVMQSVKDNAKLNKKIQTFKTNLEKYKNYAAYKTVPELLNIIEDDLDLLTKIYASDLHEESVLKYNKFKNSLPNMLLVDYLQETNKNIPIEASVQSNSVKIMTIHKSKGLEFPVVFMIGMGRNFNMKSIYGDCLLSKEYGIGLSYFDENARYKEDTLAIKAIRMCEKEKLLEEQQRLLYVGMTRAINFLYIVGSRDHVKLSENFENPTCFLDWFTESLFGEPMDKLNVETFDLKDISENMPQVSSDEIIFVEPDSGALLQLNQNFNSTYKHVEATNLPVKSSFTALSRDDDFVYHKNTKERTNNALEVGNSYHKLMQFISFDATTKEGVEKEITRLIDDGVLSEKDKELIDAGVVAKILSMSIFDDIRQNDCNVIREREFYYQMPAKNFVNSSVEDNVLMQGIIDLLVIKDDSFDIIDYKTSRLSEKELIDKYKKQLAIYSEAMQAALGKPLGKAIIVSLTKAEAYKIL